MNKYKSALSDIMCCVPYGKLKEQEEILIELVEKATPKKLAKRHFEMQGYPRFSYECPNCHKFMGLDIAVLKSRYCDNCGHGYFHHVCF